MADGRNELVLHALDALAHSVMSRITAIASGAIAYPHLDHFELGRKPAAVDPARNQPLLHAGDAQLRAGPGTASRARS